MPMQTIGTHYDSVKFDNIINGAAFDLVKSTMGNDAETDKGAAFTQQVIANLKAKFVELPVTYYQALDAFADGREIGEYLKSSDENNATELETLENGSFIDVVLACSDGKLRVKNEKAAVSYYNRLFPEAQVEMAEEVHNLEIDEADRSASQAHRKVERKESFENFSLRRAMSAFEKANSKFADWSKLEQSDMSGSEMKRFEKIKAELDLRRQRLDDAKERAIISVRKRFERGEITQEHLDMRIAQIESGDLSLREKRAYEQPQRVTVQEQTIEAPTVEELSLNEDVQTAPVATENVNKYHIDFKQRHIELGSYAPQTPVNIGKEKERSLDEAEREND